MDKRLEKMIQEVSLEIKTDILPFWKEKMTDPEGGFYGRMDGHGNICKDAPKGGILNARILWTFAAACEQLGEHDPLYESVSGVMRHAKEYIQEHLIDHQDGGSFWCLDSKGEVLDGKKQFYSIAFTIYALAQHYAATGEKESLQTALELFDSIEEHSLDRVDGGYIEACTRDWQPIQDMRLSEKDRNDAKTMNTHLHILEAYTGLYRVCKQEKVREALRRTIMLFLEHIVGKDGHLVLFFDEKWNATTPAFSYGHDIECSWLLKEAALVLSDEALTEQVSAVCARIALAAVEGLQEDGSMIYEHDPETLHTDRDRHWWVQAESVVGFLWQWKYSGEQIWLERALNCWEFIKTRLIAPDGEWYWSIKDDGSVNLEDDRAGFWKCPYHNGRMCLEVMKII
ncbi:MAG: AGE family epimerase/isomerase [Bacteroidales bacterium]|nr:AGE family epimerase/isomerase [Bacteroidales bacterium]